MNVAPPLPPADPHPDPHPSRHALHPGAVDPYAVDPHAYDPSRADHQPDPPSPGVRTRHPMGATVSIMIVVCLLMIGLALVAML